jgi:hypothetical protein
MAAIKGFELNAVSRTTKPIGAKSTGFKVNPGFVKSLSPRPEFTSPYYCTECAPPGNQTRNISRVTKAGYC